MIETRVKHFDETVTDEELVKRLKKGDDLAFESLVNRYEQKIYNLIWRIVGNSSTASDILQETFLKVYHAINTFQEKSKFSTWLYRIAVNFSLMHKRIKYPVVSLDTPIESEDGGEIHREFTNWADNPEADSENSELRKRIGDAIDLLPEEYRSALILHDLQGLSNKETGKILKISVPAVKSRVHRGRLLLRENLSKYFGKK